MTPKTSDIGEAPNHAVLDRPWTYEIAELHFVNGSEAHGLPSLDLVLRKEVVVYRLRFEGVRGFRLGRHFECDYIGLEILDISSRGWEGLNVWVGSYEGDYIEFWSRSVALLNPSAV